MTAPLRRLVDRFGLVVCEAVSQGGQVPDWVREALPTLPDIMSRTDQKASQAEHGCTDAVEAAVLAPRVGETFAAYVVDTDEKGITVQLVDLAVTAKAEGSAEPGAEVRVKLSEANIEEHRVRFELV